MRRILLALLSIVLAPVGARAQFSVDTANRVVETSRLRVRFDLVCPERVAEVRYKPWSADAPVNSESYPWEFSGQMIQGLWAAQGPIFSQAVTSQSWAVVQQTASRLWIRIESQSTWGGVLQTPVRTDYTFFADSSGFQVERTLLASQVPMPNTSLQPYVLRLRWFVFTSGQFRSGAGTLMPIAYCGGGCSSADWDQRWARTEGPGIACTLMYASTNPGPMLLMGDNDSNSQSSWTGALTTTRTFDADVTWRLYVHFSTTPDNDALEDDVYAWFDALPTSGVQGTPDPALSLGVRPNPARGAAEIAFTLPRAAEVDVVVADVAGRVVARLGRGPRAAGAHRVRWDGRDERERPLPAGVYFARVTSGRSVRTRRMVWLR